MGKDTAQPMATGVLVQQGSGYLSPRVHTFLCCSENGDGSTEDPQFYIMPAKTVLEAAQRGYVECPALWVDSSALEVGSGVLQVVYRLGGTPVASGLPFKPIKLQPVKQCTGAAGASRTSYRAFVSSSIYTQAYRITAGLLPKLATLHDHLASSGIPLAAPLQPGVGYSSDGLRAMQLREGLLLERCDPGTGQTTKLKISINFQNACLELHDAAPGAATVHKCLRTINTLAEAVVALEGRPGAGPLAASPVKAPARRGGAPAHSPAKPPLPSGLDSVRQGIALIQACSAAQLREGVALLSAAAGSVQLAASAVIMGALEALVSAAASVQPSSVMGMTELHLVLSQVLCALLDAAPPSAHAAARTVTVVGAVLTKNCANPKLLCRLLSTLLQRPGVRLEAMHQGLASALACAYLRLAPGLEAQAQALLAQGQPSAMAPGPGPGAEQALREVAAGPIGPGTQVQQPPPLRLQQQGPAAVPALARTAAIPAASAGSGGGSGHPGPAGATAAFGSPQVVLVEVPAPEPPGRARSRASKPGSSLAARPLAALPAVRTRPAAAPGPAPAPAPPPQLPQLSLAPEAPQGKAGYVAHMVSTFNAIKLENERPQCASPLGRHGSNCVLTRQDRNVGSPPKAASPARSVSAMSTLSTSRVPRLLLPGSESPTGSTGGLTRSTRRALGCSPAGRRSPSPTRFGSPMERSMEDAEEQSASAELAALARALGEGLMAADLPAIIAHKRRASANLGSVDEEVAGDLLRPPTPGARKSLEAHKIFVTARSLKSLESSPSHTTDSTYAANQVAGGTARQLAETEHLKCLLLEALLASLPVVGSIGYPSPDPSPVLAMEVLSLLDQNLSPQQQRLSQLCQRTLQQLSQPAAPPGEALPHVLLALSARKLLQLMPQLGAQGSSAAQAEAVGLLQLMADYVGRAQGENVGAAAAQHCSSAIQSLVGVLLAAGMDVSDWGVGPWRLLHRLAALLAAVCAKVWDASAGRTLLRVLLADQQTVAMLTAAASLVLLHPEVAGSPAFPYRAGLPMLQRDTLRLLIELAALVGRQPPAQPPQQPQEHQQGAADMGRTMSRLSSISSVVGEEGLPATPTAMQGADLLLAPGPKGGKRLTRSQAFHFLWPFISAQSGFVRRILDQELSRRGRGPAPATPATPASGDSVRLRHDVLQMLKLAFSAAGNPFVEDKATTDFYVQFHFIQFLKLYHNPQRDHQALALCKKHMEVLLALASCKAPHSRKRFKQLSVMDFFVREVSLEFECSEPTAARARVSRSGSTEPRRRSSSSFSLDGDTTTRRLSDRSGREGSLPPAPPSLGKSEPPAALTPPTVPALRLPFKPAESSFSVPQQQQQQGGGGGGRPALGLNIPRLNIPMLGSHSLGSPVEGQSPTAPPSARLGRPPLPPSARTARMGTPRTSRLGRPAAEGLTPLSLPNAGPDAAINKLGKSPFAINAQASASPPATDAAAPAAGRISVPRLGLARVGLGRGPLKPPLASPGSEGASSQGAQQASPAPGSVCTMDSDGDSSDDEEPGLSSRPASARQPGPTPTALEVPAGFVWSGDLDEDVARLEALEGSDGEEEEEEVHSPMIPAHRHDLNGDPAAGLKDRPVPSLLLGAVPRLALPSKSPPLHDSSPGGAGGLAPAPALAQEAAQLPAIPRLNLSHSMHSNLEMRTASAELQVAVEAERAKRKVGRTFLGDLEKSALGKGKMQAVNLLSGGFQKGFLAEREGGAVSLEVSYDEERGRRLLYKDETLHLQVLQLIFVLLFGTDSQLDPAYIDQLPWQRKMLNIPHILHHHLNHHDTRPLLVRLLPLLHGLGAPAMRLLRVLCGAFFRPDWYSGSRCWIGKGAYAQVYRYQLPEWTGEGTVVFKVLDLPRHFEDHCRQVDFFNEVSILEALAPSPRVVQLLDFGIDTSAEAMFLVMKDYRCSLRKWREAQPADPRGQLRLYLAIFQQVLSAVKSLMEANVLHFDLKCDNILLEPLPGAPEAEFWAPQDAAPPFRVVLADFGESKLFTDSLDGAMTVRNRGTECAKSPEMLLAANACKKDTRTYDRRRREGAGAASDVWSLGCLLYELLTGQFLFSVEPDWVRFFVHITDPRSGQLITPDKAHAVQHLPGVLGLLQYIMVRDARLRPTMHDVEARVEALLHGNRVRLPAYVSPAAHSDAQAPSGPLQSSHRPLQSPTMLHSPRLAAPLPLAVPLPFAPGLLLAPLSAAQSAQSLQQLRPLQRVVLLVTSIPQAPSVGATDSQPSTARSSAARALLAPISNTMGSGSGLVEGPGGTGSTAAGSSPRSCSDGCSSLASSPTKSVRAASGASNTLGSVGGGAASSSVATSRLGTPRGASCFAAAEPIAMAVPATRAEGGRRSARPLFNSARVHAASATDVPSVFEVARGPELGGCSEWPGSASAEPRQPRLSQQSEPRAPPRRPSSCTPPHSPRGAYHPLLPPGFLEAAAAGGGGGGSRGVGGGVFRSTAEDAACHYLLSTPELVQCGTACTAAGVKCKLVPCPRRGSQSSGGIDGGGPWQPQASLHHWLRLALQALPDESGSRGGEWGHSAPPSQQPGQPPAVLLAAQPGCEPELAVLAVAHLMQRQRLGLYQAMVHAAQWGVDLHLREPHVRALQRWGEGLDT